MTVLTGRQLNRATLRRQLLTDRAAMPALDAVRHLVGMQAQAPFPPYTGLWSRLAGFDPAELAGLLLDRRVVRIALMRGTVHLVAADDCLTLRPLLQPLLDRQVRGQHRADLAGQDQAAIVGYARALVEAEPRPTAALGAALVERWPEVPRQALLNLVRAALPLVQVPPRAVWGASGTPTVTTAQQWLGRPLGTADARAVVLRHLAAFGPASVADLQKWSGLSGLREIVAGLDLAEFTDEAGRRLHDLPDAPRPDGDEPVPVRFLPEYDNVLISYADAGRIVAAGHRPAVFGSRNGIIAATVLVDGYVAATWRLRTTAAGATLTVTPLVRLGARVRRDIEAEGDRLLAFAAAGAADRQVRFD
jgi:winged helix DNA-binding protein